MTTIVNKSQFFDKLNEYYILKKKYNLQLMFYKHDILETNLSIKEKKYEYSLIKPKCVNCKRPVGTNFSLKYLKYNKDTNTFLEEDFVGNKKGYYGYRFLMAKCGDKVEPCNLDIILNLGVCNSFEEDIKTFEKSINKTKNEIIDLKNKLLFGYIDKDVAIQKFNLLQNEITDDVDYLQSVLEPYKLTTDNQEKKRELNIKIQESFDLIGGIKSCMTEYNSENNIQYVKDALDIYINSLSPKLNEILKLKYNVCEVVFDTKENVYNLMQSKNSIEQLEFISDEPEVVKFVVGTTQPIKSKNENVTKKNKKTNENSAKTQKLRAPQYEIVSDEEEEEQQSQQQRMPKGMPSPVNAIKSNETTEQPK